MKYTKTSIGEVAFLETDANYKDSLKKIPKEARVMKSWELHKLQVEEPEKLRGFPKGVNIWTKERLSSLDRLGVGSRFYASDWHVDNPNVQLRGICVVKKVKK